MSVSKLTYNSKDYDDEIVAEGGRIEMTHAMAGETLSADSLVVPITTGGQPIRFLAADQDENDLFLYTADGKVFCVGSGSGVPEYIKNSPGFFYFDNDLLVKQYLYQIKRRSMYEHEMIFYSAVWLLEQSDHVGGLYTGQTVETVLGEVLGSVVAYSIDDDIKSIQIYGYLPYDKRRNNLMKVLMAVSAALKNAVDGSLRVTQLSASVAGVFDENRVYIGGTVSDEPAATAIQVTEHNYLPSTEEITLFDDSTLGTETVIFTEPYHNLSITGGTITASGVNFCTFSATGAVVLTGQRYTHVTRIVTVGDAPTGVNSDTVRRVTDNTLLTPNNAVAVAEKLFDYLTKSQIIRQDVIVGTERPADVVSVVNPYTKELVDACIKSMSIQVGKNGLKATCEFLVGYVPAGATAGFENYVLLTGAGVWIAPDKNGDGSSYLIRLIIAGAGSGGTGGGAGRHSVPGTTGQGGSGGEAGEAGQGGLIFEINLTVTPGASYSFSCGVGGIGGSGGVPNYSNPGQGAPGQVGADTTFGALSSAVGRLYPYGYSEPKSGLTIAEKGDGGALGGRGSNAFAPIGETITHGGVVYDPGTNGTAFGPVLLSGKHYTAYPGGGGGAAVGNNGGNGGNGSITYNEVAGVRTYYIYHGSGGQGASAIAGEDAINMGQGGHGGHGGGGGGYRANAHQSIPSAVGYEVGGPGGAGGSGGDGGTGGPGVIVIYY